MKKIPIVGMALFLIIGMVSCGTAQEKNTNATVKTDAAIAKNVNTTKFQVLIASKKEGILLDVRTPEELEAEGSIEGNINIDFFAENFKGKLNELAKDKPVMVYCAVGGRSGQAMQMMKKMGFKEVYNLSGGIRAWQSDGKPVK